MTILVYSGFYEYTESLLDILCGELYVEVLVVRSLEVYISAVCSGADYTQRERERELQSGGVQWGKAVLLVPTEWEKRRYSHWYK